MLEVLGYDLATPTPAVWVEIFGRGLSLGRKKLLLLQHSSVPGGATLSAG